MEYEDNTDLKKAATESCKTTYVIVDIIGLIFEEFDKIIQSQGPPTSFL